MHVTSILYILGGLGCKIYIIAHYQPNSKRPCSPNTGRYVRRGPPLT